MLYRLEIENFLSIRERQILDLTIAPNVPDDDGRFAPIFPGSEKRAPKVVSIYGANASGKTTILRALDFVSRFARWSAQLPETKLNVTPFADAECSNKPMSFAIEFGGIVNFGNRRKHKPDHEDVGTLRYELEIEISGGCAKRVLREALRQRPEGKGKWQRIFEREADGTIANSDHFPLATYLHLKDTLTEDTSVLSSWGRFKHPTAMHYSRLGGEAWSNLSFYGSDQKANDRELMDMLSVFPKLVQQINRDLSRVDTGIEEMQIETYGSERRAIFTHSGLGTPLLWESESQGTQAFVRLFPILNLALNEGGQAYIDEFDTLIHPTILPEIVRWFYDKEVRNSGDAQVWMSCHSATLLEDLVKEEVVITEKNSSGETKVYSLMDVQSTRRDENLYKKYLGGVYGGIPVIG